MGCGASTARPESSDANPVTAEKISRDGMQLSLNAVLAAPDALEVFLAYAKKDLSEENLEFWLEVKAFKERWDKTTSTEEHNKDAKFMISEFLSEGSPRQVHASLPSAEAWRSK